MPHQRQHSEAEANNLIYEVEQALERAGKTALDINPPKYHSDELRAQIQHMTGEKKRLVNHFMQCGGDGMSIETRADFVSTVEVLSEIDAYMLLRKMPTGAKPA